MTKVERTTNMADKLEEYDVDVVIEDFLANLAVDSEEAIFLLYVFLELKKAREKFPSSAGVMVALMEEVGELSKAVLEESHERVICEAVQVACVAARVAVEGDSLFTHFRRGIGLDVASDRYESKG